MFRREKYRPKHLARRTVDIASPELDALGRTVHRARRQPQHLMPSLTQAADKPKPDSPLGALGIHYYKTSARELAPETNLRVDIQPTISFRRFALKETFKNPRRKLAYLMGAVAAVSVGLFGPSLLEETASADTERQVSHVPVTQPLEACTKDDFPAVFGRPMQVGVSTPEQREQFYDDFQAAEDFVSDQRHIVGSDIDIRESLCEFTDDSDQRYVVISPQATARTWEMSGVAPDAGAELVPFPGPDEGYFAHRQPAQVA